MSLFRQLARLFAVAVLIAPGVGCRVPRQVELLQREVRRRDERIFELEYRLEQLQGSYLVPDSFGGDDEYFWLPEEKGRASRRSGSRSTGDDGDASRPTPAARDDSPAPRAREADPPIEATPSDDFEPFDEPPVELDGANLFPQSTAPRHRRLPGSPSDREPTRIVVNELLTAAYSGDVRRGGVQLVCELRDAAGRPVRSDGEVEVRLVDAQTQGAGELPMTLGRRGFLAAETAAAWSDTPLGPQMRFDVPLTKGRPVGDRLAVDVAYRTVSGRVLTDRSEIDLGPDPSAEFRRGLTRTGGESLPRNATPTWSPRRR